MLTIRQKERRIYENSSFAYEYMWVRVILVQREFDGGCRWIMGKYSNHKSINLETVLTPGDYFLVVMPEWKDTHCHELHLFAHSRL